jgi:hypothetical protein
MEVWMMTSLSRSVTTAEVMTLREVRVIWGHLLTSLSVPRVRWRKTRRAYLAGGLSAGSVSQTCYYLKGESWLRAATLDDSKTPTPVLHNTSVVVWNLYCVRVIIVRLNKRSKPRSFVHINNRNNQNMIKKLCASYQEIEAIAE